MEKSMEVHELVRIVHLADAIEVICDETGLSISDCLDRLKGIDGLRSGECEQIKLYHMNKIRNTNLITFSTRQEEVPDENG